jgi:hypothetical protein
MLLTSSFSIQFLWLLDLFSELIINCLVYIDKTGLICLMFSKAEKIRAFIAFIAFVAFVAFVVSVVRL